jgi:LuxR family maltose regulon positive regulatory protein
MAIALHESPQMTLRWTGAESRPGLLLRRRLVRRLLSGDPSLLLFTAPAGFGKTTLLQQLAHSDARPSAWLTLHPTDNDPDVFLHRLGGAVAGLMSIESDPARAEGANHPRTVRPLSKLKPPFLLLLDGVDALASSASLAVLSDICANVPAGCCVALASRTTPDIGIGGQRALGRVMEIGAQDLAFTATEAVALGRATGVDLLGDSLDDLMMCTEGWATGLFLSLISQDAPADIAGISGDDPLITDYLWDELLRSLPESTFEFLIRSSVLNRMTGTACDAVLRRNGSGGVLRELCRSNMFIVPLDRHQRAYRYYRFFAQALRAELHRRDPALEAELHRRASDWYESQGDADVAIQHATMAGDVARAASLIWGEISPARNPLPDNLDVWLSAFSERDIEKHTPLALAMAWQSAERGDGNATDKWVSVAERGYHRGPLPGGPASLAAAVSLLRAKLGREGISRMERDASHACELDGPHGSWRGVARYFQGVAHSLLGDREPARTALQECARRCCWWVPATYAECLAQLALIAADEGDIGRFHELTGQALDVVDELEIRMIRAPAIVLAAGAFMHAQKGAQDTAEEYLQRATTELARYTDFAPWLGAQCRLVMARTHLALSDADAAKRLTSEAGLLLYEIPDAATLHKWLDEIKRAARDFPVPSRNGGASLTAAELRVLRYLPTHLSFPDIGDRLCISRNTVKSQAMSVYRKLGVGSRGAAVARARTLGLLDHSDDVVTSAPTGFGAAI